MILGGHIIPFLDSRAVLGPSAHYSDRFVMITRKRKSALVQRKILSCGKAKLFISVCPELQEELTEARTVPTNRNLYHSKSTW